MNNEYFFLSCFFTQQNQWLWLLVLIGQHIKKYSILLICEISWRSNYLIDLWSRSSRSRIFLKIGFLKFRNSPTYVFSCEYCKIDGHLWNLSYFSVFAKFADHKIWPLSITFNYFNTQRIIQNLAKYFIWWWEH